ncbi:MAG: helicase-related protein, partial [Bacteroidales bacterium]|nr:helicase-related protein [Bacteroidales bacterium]
MSSQFITNQQLLLDEVIKEILPYSDKLYFLIGYFYFSGFEAIYSQLADKEIKILVGLEIEQDILNRIKEVEWLHSLPEKSRDEVRKNFNETFVKFFNETEYFDSASKQQAFKIFIEKIKNGTLEIRKTIKPNHAKLYLFQRKEEFSERHTYIGTLITGSSNLTASGLHNQYELNVILRSTNDFMQGKEIFDALWNDAVIIADKNHLTDFEEQVIEKIWFEKIYNPYLMYVRVLHEFFHIDESQPIKLPSEITRQRFFNLKYQTDAIRQALATINNHNGVIIADVVGLGKSIIASAVAHNLRLKTIIIAPPHLCYQWDYEYKEWFELNARVFSSGLIDKALEYYEKSKTDEPFLIIIDEAHKYRNENTQDYLNLHKICQGNKVILLTATPYNNNPQDIFTLLKLFQIPSKTTLNTVVHLGYAFESLITQYKQLAKDQKKKKVSQQQIKQTVDSIAQKIRDIIYPLVIRRSRIDLMEIDEYKKDLEVQNIAFSEVEDPILLEYQLDKLEKLYQQTLEQISSEDKRNSYKATRYKPVSYIKNFEKYKQKIEQEFGDFHLFKEAQQNLSQFMRHLLVRRFESSMYAFKTTLQYMIKSSENILQWIEKRNSVPIFKKGYLPNIEDFNLSESDNTEAIFDELSFEKEIQELKSKGLFEISADEMRVDFRTDLEHDIKILKEIYHKWFGVHNPDPKLKSFRTILSNMLANEPQRKIIVFSEFTDTVNYLYEQLKSDFRVFKFTSSDASEKNKKIIQSNFDAGLPIEQQADDYDILIATDAISEGYNLHRAGAIFNYDIPYNPTRVIQRVGRINRINKKMFDKLYIYNYFPTKTGEKETRTKEISTLKIAMIQALLGEDTKVLTSDEELKAFFKQQYHTEILKMEEQSWETRYLNFYHSLSKEVVNEALKIPARTRVQRKTDTEKKGVLVFGKKGNNVVFRFGTSATTDEALTPQQALAMFEASPTERAWPVSTQFDDTYQFVKRNLFQSFSIAQPDKLKNDVCNKIYQAIQYNYTPHKEYFQLLLKVIEINAIPKPYLKELNNLKITDIDKIIKSLPTYLLNTILKQAQNIDERSETIIVAQEFV